MREYNLRYSSPAGANGLNEKEEALAWEYLSLPLGNGYFGANIFGRTDVERIQLTEKSLSNPYGIGGLNSFADIFIRFNHQNVSRYERGLSLNNAICYTKYISGETEYRREAFISYPERVMAIKISASQRGMLSFELQPKIPHLKNYGTKEGDGGGKSGRVTAEGKTLILSGKMDYYNILFEAQMVVAHSGGLLRVGSDENGENARLILEKATEAVIYIALGTNYKMESRVFLEPDPKKKLEPYNPPHEEVSRQLRAACEKPYALLKETHVTDYKRLFERVFINLNGENSGMPTDLLLETYRENPAEGDARYLEELYFQYGRYLLIASSRPGSAPANLQGAWNCHNDSPWSCGYWHNINVQMNYWPAFVTNLAETFEAYANYHSAYLPLAKRLADDYIGRMYPENYANEANNGWTIGTGGWLYNIEGSSIHSGPGTGAFTSMLFWEYYDFTRDENVLREISYPAIEGMANFLSKTLVEEDGSLLVKYSASPEQMDPEEEVYCFTTGCAFDQQMVWENHNNLLKAVQVLGYENELVQTVREQIGRLDPVQIGKSGQVKEFREEEYYGDIGEPEHRHISQLVGLHPGTLITKKTPEWLNGAKVTLENRGDRSTGWAMAHRLNLWARSGNGNRAHKLLQDLLRYGTLPNLWDTHPPFQIDGNLGAVSGVSEMLLQSHSDCIDLLPALPDKWASGSFEGLVARGNFVISAQWQNKKITRMQIHSRSGGECRYRLPGSEQIYLLQTTPGEKIDIV